MESKFEEIELANLIFQYKDGDNRAGEILIEYYKPLFYTLLHLIKHKQFNPHSYTQRVFLSCFAKSRVMAFRLRDKKYHACILHETNSILSCLEGGLLYIEEDELFNDIIAIFLYTLTRYKEYIEDKLQGYINKAFTANLAGRIKKILKDPLVNLANDKILSYAIQVDDDGNQSYGYSEMCKYEKENNMFIYDETDALGHNWISGQTCAPQFKILNPYERTLIKLHYDCGCSKNEIALIMGAKVNVIKRDMEVAIKKLSKTPHDFTCSKCGNGKYIDEVNKQVRDSGIYICIQCMLDD